LKVDFQVVHSHDTINDIKIQLLSLLKEVFEDLYIEKTDAEISDCVEIKYVHKQSHDKYLMGFSLLVEEEGDTTEIIDNFVDRLQDSDEVHLAFKFFDEFMHEEFKRYAKEIFEIEMKLREAITFIFIDTYKEDYYNLLKEVDVRIQRIDGNQQPNEEYYKSHLENEFFFLLFSDYRKLDELKELKQSDIIKAISDSADYDSLRGKILNRGIVDEKYTEFIAEIKEYLESIEKLRNCIAHSRAISDGMKNNYIHARNRLENSINNFWNEISYGDN